MLNQNLVTKRRNTDSGKEYYVEFNQSQHVNHNNGWKSESALVKLLESDNAPTLRTKTKDNPELTVVKRDDGKYVRSQENGKVVDNLSKLPEGD